MLNLAKDLHSMSHFYEDSAAHDPGYRTPADLLPPLKRDLLWQDQLWPPLNPALSPEGCSGLIWQRLNTSMVSFSEASSFEIAQLGQNEDPSCVRMGEAKFLF